MDMLNGLKDFSNETLIEDFINLKSLSDLDDLEQIYEFLTAFFRVRENFLLEYFQAITNDLLSIDDKA